MYWATTRPHQTKPMRDSSCRLVAEGKFCSKLERQENEAWASNSMFPSFRLYYKHTHFRVSLLGDTRQVCKTRYKNLCKGQATKMVAVARTISSERAKSEGVRLAPVQQWTGNRGLFLMAILRENKKSIFFKIFHSSQLFTVQFWANKNMSYICWLKCSVTKCNGWLSVLD